MSPRWPGFVTTLVLLAILPGLGVAGPTPLHAQATVYPACAAIPLNEHFTVTLDGQASPVYAAKIATEERYHGRPYINQTRLVGFAVFTLAGPAQVRIDVDQAPQSVQILPQRWGLQPTVRGHTIEFTLPRPGPVVVQFNDDPDNHLYLFAQPPEKDIPSAQDPNVIYYGPGLHEAGAIKPERDGLTYYFAGGAVVKGNVSIDGRKNITLRGPGILYGADNPDKLNLSISKRADGLTIDGLTMIDSKEWCLRLDWCEDVTVRHVNMIHWFQNSDGIDPVSCRRVLVENCFIRNYDDGVVIKNMPDPRGERLVCTDITVRGCTVITDHSSSYKVGNNESTGAGYKNIRFEDCDALFPRGVPLLVSISGTSAVENVVFANMRVRGPIRANYTMVPPDQRPALENASPPQRRRLLAEKYGYGVIGVKNAMRGPDHPYLKADYQPGAIRNVTFRDIAYFSNDPDDQPTIILSAYNEAGAITHVNFDGVTMAGRPVTADYPGLRRNEFVHEVSFTHQP